MGSTGAEQSQPADEPSRARCEAIERLLVQAIRACDWNLSRRTCIAYAGKTDFFRSRRMRPGVELPGEGPFTYRTIMMTPRPHELPDYRFWLLVLAHELSHVVGLRTDTFRWGPGWVRGPSWPQETAWTRGSASSDSEERIAERSAELIMEYLGLHIRDPSWRVTLGEISELEDLQAQFRLGFVVERLELSNATS